MEESIEEGAKASTLKVNSPNTLKRQFIITAEESRRNVRSPSETKYNRTQTLIRKAAFSANEEKKTGLFGRMTDQVRSLLPDFGKQDTALVTTVDFEQRKLGELKLRSVFMGSKDLVRPGSTPPTIFLLKQPFELFLDFKGTMANLLLFLSAVESVKVCRKGQFVIRANTIKLQEAFKRLLDGRVISPTVDIAFQAALPDAAPEFVSVMRLTPFKHAIKMAPLDDQTSVRLKRKDKSDQNIADDIEVSGDEDLSLGAKRRAAESLSKQYSTGPKSPIGVRSTPSRVGDKFLSVLPFKRNTSPYFSETKRRSVEHLSPKTLLEQELKAAVPRAAEKQRETIVLDEDDSLSDSNEQVPVVKSAHCAEDGILLRFSSRIRGELAISELDAARLTDDVYLNDTLIDFYLAYVLEHLAAPSVMDDTHVFSTFFYSQFTSKRGPDGYGAVEKWTRDVDLFSKRFIVVPIHEAVHWYVAVIYNPGALVGESNPFKVPPITLKEMHELDNSHYVALEARRARFRSRSSTASKAPAVSLSGRPLRVSASRAIEVNEAIKEDERRSDDDFSITSGTFYSAGTLRETIKELLSPKKSGATALSATDSEVEIEVSEPKTSNQTTPKKNCSSFLHPERKIWGGKKLSELTSAERDDMQMAFAERLNKTTDELNGDRAYIFVFDSLGSLHPTAVRTLNEYLRYEATKRGKDVTNWVNATGSHAKVPLQPNTWDCGVYVLETIEVLLTDPAKYLRILLNKINVPFAWYTRQQVSAKRSAIKDLIYDLA